MFKTYEEISKSANWGTDDEAAHKTWESIEKGLRIREVKALELMASGYQHLLDELERYKQAYRQYKNKAENLEQELRQQKSVASRYRNQRDRIKEQLTENAIAL